jgi:hypothetical protein
MHPLEHGVRSREWKIRDNRAIRTRVVRVDSGGGSPAHRVTRPTPSLLKKGRPLRRTVSRGFGPVPGFPTVLLGYPAASFL